MQWIFQIKDKYLPSEEQMYFENFVNSRFHPFDVDNILAAFEEIAAGKRKDKVIEARAYNLDHKPFFGFLVDLSQAASI